MSSIRRALNALSGHAIVGTRGLSVLAGRLTLGRQRRDGERLLSRMTRVLLNLDLPPLLDDERCAAVGAEAVRALASRDTPDA